VQAEIRPECWVVTDADDGDWWLAGNGRWHEGPPPYGWVQAGDRRWYPYEPPETAQGYASKFESAGGRIATVLALGRSTDLPALEAAHDDDGDDAGEGDALAWSSDDPAWAPDDDDGIEGERRRPAWVLVSVLVALLVGVVGVVGVMAQTNDGTDREIGPTVDTAPPTSASRNSTTTTTVEGETLAPAVTVEPPVSSPSTTVPPRSSTTVPPRPSTTVPPPDTTIVPSTTVPSPGGPPVREGGRCSNVGATAVTSNGTPVTCSTTACDGDRYNEPRWRRTIC
jgi:hypothetical protein